MKTTKPAKYVFIQKQEIIHNSFPFFLGHLISFCCTFVCFQNIKGPLVRGHSKSTWTNFNPILTPFPPRVDKPGHFIYPPSLAMILLYVSFSNFASSNVILCHSIFIPSHFESLNSDLQKVIDPTHCDSERGNYTMNHLTI